ncbi:Acyl-CoA reductase (LuxC) [Catalinimonas alkaloidigena]|uniref:Acyl-CoA reductase (LuxC) n=1 Tax=Catalinimonas alkaloidigena TaxID=1075417 RepID=A0A1G9EKY2_9BACT|nr:acyl-CoA reductase [Catalinimonas alkaloidigena]SDK76820.1 Acyl-CoA reductase (LuxC) [Catalinimonas alkaloidigena]
MQPLSLAERLEAFVQLREQFRRPEAPALATAITQASQRNGWFTEGNILTALAGLVRLLEPTDLRTWLDRYPLDQVTPKQVGVVMAGNIPLVGFHDMMSVLLSGHTLLAKLSSQDEVLPTYVRNELVRLQPAFADRIQFVERLNDAEAIIATGSDNTARYFHHYFASRPHIIRQNRASAAVLDGQETPADFAALADDIFLYFGLGCRNVAKLYVPEGYDFVPLLEVLSARQEVILHHKYANNYDYRKSIYLVNRLPHLDNGIVLLEEKTALVSPLAVLYYEFYQSDQDLTERLAAHENQLQTLVSREGAYPGSVPFGTAQRPRVWEYADGVDTMQFLVELPTGTA